jgi:hypothetical protein
MVFPGNLTRNTYCGMCVECLKTCPKNNIVINLRPFGSDLLVAKERRPDEAYKAFIMLGCALLYSVVLLGPWGWLKNWANMDTLPHWAIYAAGFLAINLLALPGLFWLAAAASRRLSGQTLPLRRLFVDYAYTLVPLGLSGWIAFSLGFVLVNGSYALGVASDPFGWGWNLFGTAQWPWTPYLSSITPLLQVLALLGGLVWTSIWVRRIAQEELPEKSAARQSLPVMLFCLVFTIGMLWLLVG